MSTRKIVEKGDMSKYCEDGDHQYCHGCPCICHGKIAREYCTHKRLNEDGICRTCGKDCRRGS